MLNKLNKERLMDKDFNTPILIVDDTLSASELLRSILSSLGYKNVDTAKSKEESFKLTSKKNYNIIFMDYHLKDSLSGITLINLLKEKAFVSKNASVIVMSTDTSKNAVLDTFLNGINSYILKPYTKKTIEEKTEFAEIDFLLFEELKKIKKIEGIVQSIKWGLNLISKNKTSRNFRLKILEIINTLECKEGILKEEDKKYFKDIPYFNFLELKNNKKSLTYREDLELFCSNNPLSFEAKECLLDLYIEENEIKGSKLVMLELIEMVPSNIEIMLKISKYALKINDKKIIIKIGNSIINHLQIYNKDWFSNVCLYLSDVSSFIIKNKKDIDKIIKIFKYLEKKIKISMLKDKYKENILRQIKLTEVYCEINLNNNIKAKQILLSQVEKDIPILSELSTENLLTNMLVFNYFGETKLFNIYYNELKTHNYFSFYSKELIKSIKDKDIIKKLKNLETNLEIAKKLLNTKKEKESLTIYRKLAEKYPYSSEISLGLIDSILKLSEDIKTYELQKSIESVKNMYLHDLSIWKNELKVPLNNYLKESV